jgi:hypothetical protein
MSTKLQEDLNTCRRPNPGWSEYVVPDGWQSIVKDTDVMLTSIDPDYKVAHVSEDHGTLTFSFNTELTGVKCSIMAAIATDARVKSARTCVICGGVGTYRGDRYHLRTICDLCADENEKSTIPAADEDTVTLNGKPHRRLEEKQLEQPKSSSRALGDRLRFLRGLQVLTPPENARRAGISLHALLTLEAGEREPTPIEVLGLSWAFGLAYGEVFPGFTARIATPS